MDYRLAALKLLCVQLKSARQTPSQSALILGGILFQRAWLQGVLVSTASDGGGEGCFLLDDGTGVIELSLSGDFRNREWKIGMYVMVVGGYFVRPGEIPLIKSEIQYQLCFTAYVELMLLGAWIRYVERNWKCSTRFYSKMRNDKGKASHRVVKSSQNG